MTKENVDKLDFIKIKNVYAPNWYYQESRKTTHRKWKKKLVNAVYDKVLVSRIYREHLQPPNKNNAI